MSGTQLEPLPPAQFAADIAAALRAALPTLTVAVASHEEVVITMSDGSQAKAFLGNAYREYLSAPPDAFARIAQKYVAGFVDHLRGASATLDRTLIVPVIKDRQWFAAAEAAARARGSGPLPEYASERFNDELDVFYAEDRPDSMRYLESKRLAEAGVPRSELRALAVANLRRLIPKIEVRSGPAVSMIVTGGNYEASLLVLDRLWSTGSVPEGVDGDIVVAIPARDLLFFAGSRSRDGIAQLRGIAAKLVKEASYALVDTLFVYRGGRFAKFDAD